MSKFRVYITANLDWDYEIERDDDDDYEAGEEAKRLFEREFDEVMWSSVDIQEVEPIDEHE